MDDRISLLFAFIVIGFAVMVCSGLVFDPGPEPPEEPPPEVLNAV